jgi:hypothetical protein
MLHWSQQRYAAKVRFHPVTFDRTGKDVEGTIAPMLCWLPDMGASYTRYSGVLSPTAPATAGIDVKVLGD